MLRIPQSPPIIPPLPAGTLRPTWSVMIPVYNCAEYIPATLKSVLQQALSRKEMQIEVIDDASSDADIATMVKEIGQGRIQYYRQKQNVGSLRNFETCINRARGEIIHILHGDDIVLNGFYQRLSNLFETYPNVGAAMCRFQYIDEKSQLLYGQPEEREGDGVLHEWFKKISVRNRTQFPAIAVKRAVYEHLGGFYGITYGEDWEMWVRIAKHYPVAYTPTVLAAYRKHANSISGDKTVTGAYLKDLRTAMHFIQRLVPAENQLATLKQSKQYYAHYGLSIANQVWHRTRKKAFLESNIKNVLLLYTSPAIYSKMLLLYLKVSVKSVLKIK